MLEYPLSLQLLAEELAALPGVGRKTAMKYAFSLLDRPQEELEHFCTVILDAKRKIRPCTRCFNLTENDLCSVCANPMRSIHQICVVEDVRTLMAIERANSYKGLYHVLGGVLSPIDGIGPAELHVSELLSRIEKENISEVIVATNPTVEGETTAMYLTKILKPTGVRVTRLAYGVPVGADLEYADEITLSRALDGRKEL